MDDSTTFDGTNAVWTPLSGINDIVQIEGGEGFKIALLGNGTVISSGTSHPADSIPNNLYNVIQIAAGQHHALALKDDGTVVAWGDNQYNCTDVCFSKQCD